MSAYTFITANKANADALEARLQAKGAHTTRSEATKLDIYRIEEKAGPDKDGEPQTVTDEVYDRTVYSFEVTADLKGDEAATVKEDIFVVESDVMP